MNVVREIERLNQKELERGTDIASSWHSQYKDSAWVFVGGLHFDLSEGDVLCVMSQWGEVSCSSRRGSLGWGPHSHDSVGRQQSPFPPSHPPRASSIDSTLDGPSVAHLLPASPSPPPCHYQSPIMIRALRR